MRSSSGSNNNNRSSILALFLDAPTTDALLTLPSVRKVTRPGHLALVLDARASCLPSPRKQRRDAVKRASARWRHDRARGWPSATTAAQTLSPAGAAGLMVPAAASSFVAGLVDGFPMAWLSAATTGRPGRRRVPAVRCYGTLRSQKYKIMGWLHHKMLQMGVFSTHLEQR